MQRVALQQVRLGAAAEVRAQISQVELQYTFVLPASVQVTLRGVDNFAVTVADTATTLVSKAAFAGSESWAALSLSHEVRALCDAGFLVANAGGSDFQMTQEGLSALSMYSSFSDFEPVAVQSHDLMQLPEPSTHELLQLMEAQGWVWERLTQKRARDDQQQMLTYEIGDSPRIFRSSGLMI